jgi:ADP-ribosylglycohydrolase
VVAANNLREGMHAPQSGSCNHQMWSDGVAMAIGSAGIAAAGRPRKAAELADRLGAVSNGRDGLYTARAVAAAISVAMTGANPDEMVDAAVDALPRDSWSYRCMVQARRIGAANTGDHARLVGAINEQLIYGWWPWADLATEAVPVAFAFFLALKGDFARAVPTSIRIGRDADTIGAIVGSLSGAYGGFDAIPEEWRERVTVSQGNAIGFIANRPIVEVADALAEGVTYEAL